MALTDLTLPLAVVAAVALAHILIVAAIPLAAGSGLGYIILVAYMHSRALMQF
ncbi:uncharacterized protein BDR25DRAFT_304486 [Lindgomyces ingoldianus]|uniref:Uncharacterized protein n=1 Tax=Lindgomyces ingoldianus TaxID=673940 RepID=A0ACB6QQW1_9PLEO|nr:uncharacterized protein BDR25DRAFT_304486 [Lindgomyces ingoldianus]KAF2469378.1 hypothetical protein BDR25DRAFT_304486 [Lindgomyces ingoldianus]